MKRILILLSLAFFAITACNENTGDEKDTLKHVDEINCKLSSCEFKAFDGAPQPEKNKIQTYFKGEDPKLIIADHFGDSSRVSMRYYFNANKLIFVFREDFVYNRPIYYNDSVAKASGDNESFDAKKTTRFTSSYYFYENKLKKWVDINNEEVPTNTPQFRRREAEIAAYASMYIKMQQEVKKNNW